MMQLIMFKPIQKAILLFKLIEQPRLIWIDTPPHSLKDANVSSKVKTIEEGKVGIHSLVHGTSGVERRVGAPGWGL